MSTVLPFGSNNLSLYLYEPFSYTISNPAFPKLPVVTSSGGIPTSTFTIDTSKVVFASSGLTSSSTVTENFTIDVSSGTYVSSNFVTIGNGRFRDVCLNGLTGQTFNFYKNEPIQDVSLVVAFATSNIFSTPSLPVGLSFQSNTSSTWRITGTPLVQTASNNYQLITVNAGKTATSTINIAVNPERIRVNLSGSPIINNLQIGTPITERTLTTFSNYSPLTYTWTTNPPDAITFKNISNVTKTSPFLASSFDASRTLIISGTPSVAGARAVSLTDPSNGTVTVNVVASKGTITASNAFTFQFGETVLFNDASFQTTFYRGETIDPSVNSITATTYFTGNTYVPITSIISTNLPSDLSTNFVSALQRMFITGTPTASIPLGTNTYTFRASNANGRTRDTTANLSFSNDSVTLTKNVFDNCFNFILSRDIASSKTGYYPSPIRYTAVVGSGRDVSFTATGLPTGITLSNVSPTVVQLTGTPTVVTSLQNLRVKATTATNVSGSVDVSLAVLNDTFKFPLLQDASTTFFCGRPITPVRIQATTTSERPIVAYTTTNLPSGLYLSTSGLLSGTPALATTTTGVFTVTAYTGFATDSCSYNFSLIGDEALIETISNSYPISTTQPFGPIDILTQSYTGSNLTASLLGDITPYQGTNTISVQLNDNQITGDLSPVDYLFPRYNLQIKADTTSVPARIEVSNAPFMYHNALANDGSVRTSYTQTFSATGNTYYIGNYDYGKITNATTWKLGELLYYDGTISIQDRESVQGYLAWKWGLQSNLPLSHPYRNFSPNPFSPTQISNCYLWLDANDAATITKNNTSNVLSWNSLVSGLTAVFDVSNPAPVTDVSTIGSRNAIYFSNVNQRLQLDEFAPSQQARSIFAVAEIVSKGGTYTLPLLGRTDDFETTLRYNSITYNTGIRPIDILEAGAITTEVTDVVGLSPFSLTVVNSDQLGSNYVAYNGSGVSTFDPTLSGQARFYKFSGFTSNNWSSAFIQNVLDLAQVSSNLVAVQSNAVNIAPNNYTWLPASLDPSLNFTRVVTDGSAQIVVTGYLDTSGKVIVSSNNGATWDVSNTATVFNSIPVSTASLYTSNRYFIGQAGTYTPILMLGGSNMNLAVSPNGLHWKSYGTSCYAGTETYTGSFSNGLWVIGGNDAGGPMKYSRDTINWTRIAFTDFSSCRTVSHSDSVWLAGGNSVLAYSSNGINWSNSGDSSFAEVKSITAYGNDCIAGGTDPSNNAFMKYSKDGVYWFDISGTLPMTESVNSVAMTSNLAVAAGKGGTTLAWSGNGGLSWNTGTGPGIAILSNATGVAYNGSIWIAVGEGSHNAVVSTDGKDWARIDSTSNIVQYPTSVAWTGDRWIMGGYSPDPMSNIIPSMAYSEGNTDWYRLFETPYFEYAINGFAVGDPVSKPSLYYADKSDLTTWNSVSNGMDVVYSLAQSNGTIVAAGSGSSNMTVSIDNGVSWVPVTTGITGDITSIRYGNGVWMVAGTSGSGGSKQAILRYSSNLSTWTTAYSNVTTTAATRDILFDGNAWMTNIIGLFPSAITSSLPTTFLNVYHTAKKTDVTSNWLATSKISPFSSNYASYWYEKYLFNTLSQGTPSASFSIPSSPGPLLFTSPTVTSYLYYQYVPITPIEITATGIEEFGYFYAVGLPIGLELIPNPDGQSAEIRGTPVEVFNNGTTVYIFLRNGVYTTMLTLNMTVIIPRIVRQQSSAGAYTSLVRQYTEVNAAQNARDTRVFPTQERALGEFMAPEAPDVVTPSNCPC